MRLGAYSYFARFLGAWCMLYGIGEVKLEVDKQAGTWLGADQGRREEGKKRRCGTGEVIVY